MCMNLLCTSFYNSFWEACKYEFCTTKNELLTSDKASSGFLLLET